MKCRNEITSKQIAMMTLTEIESIGLSSRYDLANGHASHELAPSQRAIIDRFPRLWEHAAQQKSHEVALAYKYAFQQLANTPSLINYDFYKICPTASNSIDLVGAWLSDNHIHTALIEPTFDNLYLILKRRGVELTPLTEEGLHEGAWIDVFKQVDAVFLVNPNNPTGKVITQKLFSEIINWCAENNKILILDNSFRFFTSQTFDVYQILLDAKVTFLSIEDTGKVWPTQEIKASLLVCSKNIYSAIHAIYDEIFLCHSNFALSILTEFLKDAHQRGLAESVWKEVAKRRELFRASLDEEILSIHEGSMNSTLSVEWVKIERYFEHDLDISMHFSARNLIFLPGRPFYWNRKSLFFKPNSIRFALLKPKHEFFTAVNFLKNELKRLKS